MRFAVPGNGLSSVCTKAATAALLTFALPFAGCGNSVLDSLTNRALPAPLSATALSRHYVEVAFPTEVRVQDVSPQNFVIESLAGDSAKVVVDAVSVLPDQRYVLLTTGAHEEKEYRLTVRPSSATITPDSASGTAETAAATSAVNYTGTATPEPQLMYATALTNETVLLTFDVGLELASAQNTGNYRIGDPDLNVLSAVVGASPNTNTVMLTTTPQTDVLYSVIVTNVRSSPGSILVDPTANTAEFFGINRVDTTAPRLLSAVALGYEEVLLTFSEPLENYADDVANYSIDPPLAIVGVTPNEWGTQVLMRTVPLTAGVDYTVTVVNVEDRSGNIIDGTADTAGFGIPADETVQPQLLSAVALDCETVLATFSEPMQSSAGDPSNYSITPDPVVISAQLSDFKTQVLFTLQPFEAGTEYTLTASNLYDTVGNLIDPNADEAIFKCSAGSNLDNLGPLPRVVGAISQSNTTVLVGYDRPMGDDAIDPTRYVIVQTEVNPEVGTLAISAAEFPNDDRTLVLLTTSSQNEVTYKVTATGVHDEQGNPLAPPIGFNGLILVDPTSAVFPGTPPGETDATDSDGDGILDNEELRGRTIVITLLGGRTVEREVTSSPFLVDTDGDGLDDYVERTLNTNPRDPDTDGDVLTDEREFNFFYSDPTNQDSDGDGTDDGLEVTFFKTAPHLADTDGDGFDDGKELYELSRNPNVADLPRPNIVADNIRLQINELYTYTDTQGNTQTQTSSSESTLTQSTETKFATSDTDVLKVGVEASLEISATPSLTIGGSFGAEWTTQVTNESAQSAQQQYQSSVARSREISSTREVQRSITGASVSATVTILNEGDIAFTIGNIEVSALQQGGPGRSQFLPVATLVPAGGNNVFNLGPLIPERGPFIFQNTDVFPSLVDDLLRSPRGLVLKIANFDMTDEFGRNYAFTSQEVNDKTSEIRIDFGDGTKESFRVATYGGLDDEGFAGPAGEFVGGFTDLGETAGIPLDFALQDILGFVKNPTAFDAIVAGADGFANTVAAGDDVQEIPPATGGLDDRAVVVSAGVNGVLESVATGDDVQAKTQGYDTSATCNESTVERIIEPPNFGDGIANTKVSTARRCSNGHPGTDGVGTCTTDANCDNDAPCNVGEIDCEGKCALASDDVQVIALGAAAAPGATVVSAGPNGVLETVAFGDDERKGPGDPCTTNAQCPSGACDGRETITRIENSVNGDRNRFWVALTSELLPVGTNVGDVNLQPGFVILLAFIQDIDRDGLSAQEEYLHGSSDRDKDTDDDGLGDFSEVRVGWVVDLLPEPYQAYPDPRLADSDGDGKSDSQEFLALTDPRLSDTDLDGIKDNFEIDNVSGDPMFNLVTECTPGPTNLVTLPLEATVLNPLHRDTDGDGLDDGSEIALGTCPLDREDGPQFLDSDEDGLTDAFESTPRTISFVNCAGATINVMNVTTNPLNGDTDFDGLPDALEVGSVDLGLPALSNPDDVDTDNDGLLDYDEFANFAFFQNIGAEYAGFILDGTLSQQIGSNPADCDTDNDTLTDSFEHAGSWGVLAYGDETARIVSSNPLVADSDLDGRTDGQEWRGNDGIGYGQPGDTGDATDPLDPDTDGDDRTDGEEVAVNSNPLRPDIAVKVRLTEIFDLSGPRDGSNNSNEWDFNISVRKPVQYQTFTLLTDQSGFGFFQTGSESNNGCFANYLIAPDNYTFVPPPFNEVSFGINIGDPIILEGEWYEFDECNGDGVYIHSSGCNHTFQELITSEELAQTPFIIKTYDLTGGECHEKFNIEVTTP